jgi:hypothetical protein
MVSALDEDLPLVSSHGRRQKGRMVNTLFSQDIRTKERKLTLEALFMVALIHS